MGRVFEWKHIQPLTDSHSGDSHSGLRPNTSFRSKKISMWKRKNPYIINLHINITMVIVPTRVHLTNQFLRPHRYTTYKILLKLQQYPLRRSYHKILGQFPHPMTYRFMSPHVPIIHIPKQEYSLWMFFGHPQSFTIPICNRYSPLSRNLEIFASKSGSSTSMATIPDELGIFAGPSMPISDTTPENSSFLVLSPTSMVKEKI